MLLPPIDGRTLSISKTKGKREKVRSANHLHVHNWGYFVNTFADPDSK